MDLYKRQITVVFNIIKSCVLSNFNVHTDHLGGLDAVQIVVQEVWGRLEESAFLTSSQVLAVPLVHDYNKGQMKI